MAEILDNHVVDDWKGWDHWLEQELAVTPDDKVLLLMRDLLHYRLEPDQPTEEDLRNA